MDKPSRIGDVAAIEMVRCETPEIAYERLLGLYSEAIAEIERSFAAFSRGETPPPGEHPVYPYLSIEVPRGVNPGATTRAFGKVTRSGRYGTTITAPHLFKTYLIEQLSLLADNYRAAIYVAKAAIPSP